MYLCNRHLKHMSSYPPIQHSRYFSHHAYSNMYNFYQFHTILNTMPTELPQPGSHNNNTNTTKKKTYQHNPAPPPPPQKTKKKTRTCHSTGVFGVRNNKLNKLRNP